MEPSYISQAAAQWIFIVVVTEHSSLQFLGPRNQMLITYYLSKFLAYVYFSNFITTAVTLVASMTWCY